MRVSLLTAAILGLFARLSSADDTPVGPAEGARLPPGCRLKIGVVGGTHPTFIPRLERLGAEVEKIPEDAGIEAFRKVDIVLLPTHWGDNRAAAARSEEYRRFVAGGGALYASQPNIDGARTILPYPATFANFYTDGTPSVAVRPDHPIIRGLPASELPYPADRVTAHDPRWTVLVKGNTTGSPSLLIAESGRGRVILCTSHEAADCKSPFSDRLFVRMLLWLADAAVVPSEASKKEAARIAADPALLATRVPVLLSRTASDDWKARREAKEILAALADLAVPAAAAILARPEDPAPDLKDVIRRWGERLGDDDFEKREEAGRRLLALGRKALPYLDELKSSRDPEVRSRAADIAERIRALGDAEPIPADVLDKLSAADFLIRLRTGNSIKALREAETSARHPLLRDAIRRALESVDRDE